MWNALLCSIIAEDLAAQMITIFILMMKLMNFLIKKHFFIPFVTQIVLLSTIYIFSTTLAGVLVIFNWPNFD